MCWFCSLLFGSCQIEDCGFLGSVVSNRRCSLLFRGCQIDYCCTFCCFNSGGVTWFRSQFCDLGRRLSWMSGSRFSCS